VLAGAIFLHSMCPFDSRPAVSESIKGIITGMHEVMSDAVIVNCDLIAPVCHYCIVLYCLLVLQTTGSGTVRFNPNLYKYVPLCY